MLFEAAKGIIEAEVLFGVVAGAEIARVTGRWKPDEIEPPIPNLAGGITDNLIPALGAKLRELLETVPVRFPVKPLEHDPVVVETRLGVCQPRQGEDEEQDNY